MKSICQQNATSTGLRPQRRTSASKESFLAEQRRTSEISPRRTSDASTTTTDDSSNEHKEPNPIQPSPVQCRNMIKLQILLPVLLIIVAALTAYAYGGAAGEQRQQRHQRRQLQPQKWQRQVATGRRQQLPQPQLRQQVLRPQQKPRPRPGPAQAIVGKKPAAIANNNQNNKKPRPQKGKGKKKEQITKSFEGLGRMRGRVVKSQWKGEKIMQFLDIPYGQSPIGALRFKPSKPAEPWENLLHAFKPHLGCPSLQDMYKYKKFAGRDVDLEDCLRLTVSTKSFTGKAPVMVYIHGDFLYDGNSMEAAPGYLLEEDVVLVAVRYRLGPFGFLSTMSEDIPGNAAVHDVILALQWVQKHIASFGGDASRVTLFGQVGGASLINVLTMSPAVSEGLFHRVIYQSGSALSPAFITDNPLPATKDIAKLAGCKQTKKIEALNKCLSKLNTTELLEAFNAHGDAKAALGIGAYGGVQFVIGGPSGILPEHPGKLLASAKFTAYPTLGGSVKNVGTFILKDIYIDNFNETIIDDQLNGMGYINHIITQTNGADPTSAWVKYAEEEIFTAAEIKNGSFYKMLPGLIDMCSTIPFKNPVLLAMQANAKKLANSTYLYTFDYEGDLNRYTVTEDDIVGMPFELGVSMTDDNLYLFPWPQDGSINSNRDIKVARRMVALWTSFAANGVPKAPGMPEWPALTEETGPYLKIGKTVTIGQNYLDEYNVAVQEARVGYSLVNEEFFESLIEIKNEEDKNKADQKEEEDDEDEEDEEDVDNGNARRGNNYVIIAKKGLWNF